MDTGNKGPTPEEDTWDSQVTDDTFSLQSPNPEVVGHVSIPNDVIPGSGLWVTRYPLPRPQLVQHS